MNLYTSFSELVGNTPMVELTGIEKKYQLKTKIVAKLEMFNPSGSSKARIAKAMIEDALEKGEINSDTVIIEPTSGNTGIGLAFICSSKQMRFIAVMPENMSLERQKLIKAYGGEIVLTPKALGMKGSLDKANQLKEELGNAFIPCQFDNPVNALAHYRTTGPEIYRDTDGKVDCLVAGIGTGGTITGTSRYLKEQKDIKVIGVEPASSPLLTKGYAGPHKIQGIGANFIPSVLDRTVLDEVADITNEDAYFYARLASKEDGLFIGISSGAALAAAVAEAKKGEKEMIVVIFPDSGERYLSTDLVE